MKILFRENQPPLLQDYGIEIPMLKERAQKVRDELVHLFTNTIISTEVDPVLTDEDFYRAHHPKFLELTKSDPESVVCQTFELINSDGSYHRYNPQAATHPLSELVDLYKQSCATSYLTLLEAKKYGSAYFLGGGFHHAISTQGRGFCLFNDIIIAAKKYQAEIKNGIIWVIDIDAHKGCGTAEISAGDESIYTLSIHMKSGWPLDSEKFDKEGNLNPWFIPSTVDIGIEAGEENLYLQKLREGLAKLEQASSKVPVMCIVVDGSDPYIDDALPSSNLLQLSKEQCLERNLIVYKFLKQKNIPQAYLMSGGYGDKNWIIHKQFIENALILDK